MIVIPADNWKAAINMIQNQKDIELAILDYHMPDVDGFELAKRIHSQEGFTNLPLVLLSSLGHKADKHIRDEFAAVMAKPAKSSQLFEVIANVFQGDVNNSQDKREIKVEATLNQGFAEKYPLKILVAEDNSINQKVINRMLSKLGYRPDIVGNGLEVLETMTRQSYDVVLMDVQMPEMDGIEATKEIIEKWPGSKKFMRIIAMSAYAFQEDIDKCLEAGMDDYIVKPMKIEDLAQSLSKVDVTGDLRRGTRPLSPKDGPAIEQSILDELIDNYGEVAKEVLQIFVNDTPKQIEQLRKYIDQEDAKNIQIISHSLKSSSAIIGAKILSDMCKRIEIGARVDRVPQIEKIDQIENEFKRVVKNIKLIL